MKYWKNETCNPLFLKGTVGLMTTSVNQKKKDQILVKLIAKANI